MQLVSRFTQRCFSVGKSHLAVLGAVVISRGSVVFTQGEIENQAEGLDIFVTADLFGNGIIVDTVIIFVALQNKALPLFAGFHVFHGEGTACDDVGRGAIPGVLINGGIILTHRRQGNGGNVFKEELVVYALLQGNLQGIGVDGGKADIGKRCSALIQCAGIFDVVKQRFCIAGKIGIEDAFPGIHKVVGADAAAVAPCGFAQGENKGVGFFVIFIGIADALDNLAVFVIFHHAFIAKAEILHGACVIQGFCGIPGAQLGTHIYIDISALGLRIHKEPAAAKPCAEQHERRQ